MIRYSTASPERALQGAVAKHGQVHPALGELRGTDRPFRLGTAGRLPVDRLGVGTGRLQLRGHTSPVPYLDQKDRPAVLHQPGSCRTLGRLHPAFGVDVDSDQAMSIHDSLERLHARLFDRSSRGPCRSWPSRLEPGAGPGYRGLRRPAGSARRATEDQLRSQLADPRPELLRCPPSGPGPPGEGRIQIGATRYVAWPGPRGAKFLVPTVR